MRTGPGWRALATLAFLVTAPRAKAAEVVSERPDAVAVTIYRDGQPTTAQIRNAQGPRGLVQVTETRTVVLKAGRERISFRGVASGIVPQTAAIEGLPATLSESNYDYDLLTPGSLVAGSIGRTVQVVRTDPATGKAVQESAVIRSGPEGAVLDIGGRIEALNCSGLPERLVFDELPPGLSDKPTLSVIADVARSGRYQVRLSYLAVGLNWSADYVARIRPDGRTLDLTGWITLANHSDATFTDAATQVVAGQVARNGDTRPTVAEILALEAKCWPTGTTHERYPGRGLRPPPQPPSRSLAYYDLPSSIPALAVPPVSERLEAPVLSELGDNKLYTIPEPTTVAARQIKQIRLLEQPGVPFERLYTYRNRIDGDGRTFLPTTTTLRFTNDAASRLGKPLPGGTVAVMEPSGADRMLLAGEARLSDIPIGLPVDLELGQAQDVRVRPRMVAQSGVGAQRKLAYEIVVINGKAIPVTVELRQERPYRPYRVVTESQPHTLRAGQPTWTLTLNPGQQAMVAYGLEIN